MLSLLDLLALAGYGFPPTREVISASGRNDGLEFGGLAKANEKKGSTRLPFSFQHTGSVLLTGRVDLDQRLVHLRRQRLAFTRYAHRWRCLGGCFLRCTQLLRIGGRQRQTG